MDFRCVWWSGETTTSDGTGASTYSYDLLDRVITSTNGAGQRLGYDGAGRLTTLTYPDTSVVTRTYDAADRLTGIADWLGHSTQFAYDAADNVITQTYPNTTTAAFSYNAANQLTGLVDKQGGSTLWSYSYGRDALGQLSSSGDPLDGQTHTYGYSPLSQLTSDQRSSGGTTSWTPDGASQVTQRVDPTGPATSTLSYDAASELSSLRTVSGTTTTKNLTLSYNADGDRTGQSDSVSGASSSDGYDQEDRPITATSGLTPSSYSYDGNGLRQSKTVSGTTTAETWDTAAGLPQLVQDGSTRYVQGPDGSPIEQIASDGTVLYYYQDQIGSTRGLLNGTGQTVATYSYDPYGQLTASTGSVRTPFGFAGQYTDAETGLQYLQARSYDPATAQFLSRDPLREATGPPYAYTAADPLNLSDPTGLRGCTVGPFTLPWGQSGSTCTAQLHAQLQTRVGTDSVGNGPLNRLAQYTGASGRAYALAHPDTYAGPLGRLATGTAGDAHAAIAATPWLNDALHTPLQPSANAWVPQVIDAAILASALFDPATGLLTGAMRGAEIAERVGPVGDSLEGRTGWTDQNAAVQPNAPASQSAERGASRGLDPVTCARCFPAGTLVATPTGLRLIQTLHVGDTVLAEDPTTHKVEAEPLQAVRHDPAAPLLAIDLSDGSTITTTLTHAFWMDAGDGLAPAGWLYDEHLRVGDQLRTAGGAHVLVVGLRYNVGQADVYTLTVAHDHTFFVGTARVLVHNATCGPIQAAIKAALASADADLREEAGVADYLVKQGHDVVRFHEEVPGPTGTVGDIDVETGNVIIEVTTARQGKLPQIRKLLGNPHMNPSRKPVILYAPTYSRFADAQFKAIGAHIVRSQAELLTVLQQLGGP